MVVSEELPPTFTIKPQLRQEDDGNKLCFECQMTSNPRPEITWYRGDEQLYDDHRTVIRIKEIGVNKYKITLELDDVFETDAGLYKVLAKNKQGEVAASINLNFSPADEPHDVQIDGVAPTFAKKPSIRQEDEGKRLLFECRILAEPKPSISWYHDGTLVETKGRFKALILNAVPNNSRCLKMVL